MKHIFLGRSAKAKIYGLLFFALLGFGLFARANEPAGDSYRLKSLMHRFDRELAELRPYLSSEQKFKDEKARPTIARSLKALGALVKEQRPAKIEDNANFSLNFALMSSHLQRTAKVFDQGGFEYARRNLNAVTGFCVTCHTQVPVPKKRLGGIWSGPDVEAVTFENAEYLFITRRFDGALRQFDELARRYPKSGIKEEQLREIYNHKLALFVRVMKDPQAARDNFKKDLENTSLPGSMREKLTAWSAAIDQWKKEQAELESMDTEHFMAAVRKLLPENPAAKPKSASDDPVRDLRLSGLLYEHLLKNGQGKWTQEILYDLALFERKLAGTYWYSLYPSYLQECIMKFPKTPLAKTCFQTYESDVREQFAAGLVRVPEELESTLSALKRNI